LRYPVVYLLHGLPGSPSEYVAGGQLLSFADTQIASGRLRPFIAVMPSAGASHAYNGEWAGAWERYVVDSVAWTARHFRTIADPSARTIAGLSAGGFGAVDIALRNLSLFGTVESWSGYFTPLHDPPFTHASNALLRANDPMLLAVQQAAAIRRAHLRFYLSTGPTHSHLIRAAATLTFARLLHRLGVPTALMTYRIRHGQWRVQVQTGLAWAFATTASG
jgi:enterochelin esterase-like enzyme